MLGHNNNNNNNNQLRDECRKERVNQREREESAECGEEREKSISLTCFALFLVFLHEAFAHSPWLSFALLLFGALLAKGNGISHAPSAF